VRLAWVAERDTLLVVRALDGTHLGRTWSREGGGFEQRRHDPLPSFCTAAAVGQGQGASQVSQTCPTQSLPCEGLRQTTTWGRCSASTSRTTATRAARSAGAWAMSSASSGSRPPAMFGSTAAYAPG